MNSTTSYCSESCQSAGIYNPSPLLIFDYWSHFFPESADCTDGTHRWSLWDALLGFFPNYEVFSGASVFSCLHDKWWIEERNSGGNVCVYYVLHDVPYVQTYAQPFSYSDCKAIWPYKVGQLFHFSTSIIPDGLLQSDHWYLPVMTLTSDFPQLSVAPLFEEGTCGMLGLYPKVAQCQTLCWLYGF